MRPRPKESEDIREPLQPKQRAKRSRAALDGPRMPSQTRGNYQMHFYDQAHSLTFVLKKTASDQFRQLVRTGDDVRVSGLAEPFDAVAAR